MADIRVNGRVFRLLFVSVLERQMYDELSAFSYFAFESHGPAQRFGHAFHHSQAETLTLGFGGE